ncbi:vWA domain-containing protein [Marinobacter sp.]|uniref:vWA domain-containing protein n=1 Tax=Marinobacter sp. TaxID=50741 RepID=UPI001B5A706E|nr:vWA domain-containing protein [Marinobacter sp.]MBQ0834540.1 VWA domain-containing protein [Marinobacter sp.]
MSRLLTLVLVTAVWLPGTLWAQETTKLTLPERADVRIIVDISGSMKQTDPNDLRQPAVRLLAGVIPEGNTAGVWTFGQYVNMLVPHGEVTDSWRKTAIDRSQQINSVALRTNLGKAIEVASDDYVTGGTLENTHFILLTDGNVDISDSADVNQAEEKRILGEILTNLAARGATFHPVALSDLADAGFLKTLAEKSQGSFRIADTAESLNLAFLDALNSAAPQEQIPIEGNAFTVDSGVKEFTALVFRDQIKAGETAEPAGLQLIQPDGETLLQTAQPGNVRWAREEAYDLVTITEPQAGEWRLKGELGEGSRVTVVSDLRMVVGPVPATFTAKSPVEVRVAFFEKTEKVINPEFLDVISVELSLTSEDGHSGKKALSPEQPPEDGEYTDTINKLPAEGLYRLDIVADGKTFARKFTATTEFMVPVGLVESTIEAPIDISFAEQAEQTPAAEPAPQPAAEPEEEPSNEEEPSAIKQPSAITEPSAIKDPIAEKAQEDESALPMPIWMIGAGGGLLLVIALIIFLLRRKRRSEQAEVSTASEETESLDDLQQEMADIEAETPILMPEEPEEPEENIPELTEPAQDDEEEFGLDDFDLSEFDDLPEYYSSDTLDPDTKPGEEPDDEQKK